MIERIKEHAKALKPAMVELAQRAIRCPSLTGEEGEMSEIFLEAH